MIKNKNSETNLNKPHGSGHWIVQRLTAIILIFSGIWVFYFASDISGHSMGEIITIMQRTEYIIPLIIFLITGLYHAALGMEVIIEDYVANICIRNTIIIAIKTFSFITIIAGTSALIYLMVL
ncbi:MAG UNVERIFIED_CONTAM: succinate dehydrogenase, hydrophobic membrane anchor protein [Rickettsiaceae bacterium]|jgi:succinate dehydrogenase / fumarate reductase membrane anchor subunit